MFSRKYFVWSQSRRMMLRESEACFEACWVVAVWAATFTAVMRLERGPTVSRFLRGPSELTAQDHDRDRRELRM